MTASNLPPGVNVGDLPGNRPEDEDGDLSLDQWAELINQWAETKGWNKEMPSEGEWIALAHSELSEALEAHRNPELPDVALWFVDGKPEGVAIEYADCLIRILHWFARQGISANEMVEIKMKYNEGRPYRHGGKEL